jgi:hypothetical protein
MHGRVIRYVLHLIDQSHRAGITAEEFKGQFTRQFLVIQLRNISPPLVHYFLPTIF